jgi:hypothetical protein
MPVSTPQLILKEFRGSLATIWAKVWNQVVCEALTLRVCELIDVPTGTLRSGWEELDESRLRRRCVPNSAATRTRCVELLVENAAAPINELLGARNRGKVGKGALRSHLEIILPSLMNASASENLARQNPFPDLWPAVADQLARTIWDDTAGGLRDPDWLLLQRLLLSGFFATCRLTTARQVHFAFLAATPGLLCLRGTFVRIPEQIAADGIRDKPVPVSARYGSITLHHAALSPLLDATAREAEAIAADAGFVHHDVLRQQAQHGRLLFGLPANPDNSAFYRLFEETVLTYLTLSSIEQLVRAWASHRGIAHLKLNGQPAGVLEWTEDLPCSKNLRNSLTELYDSGHSNVRNRVMHGNLLEIEGKKLETQLPFADPTRLSRMAERSNSFLPENISQFCLATLELLDQEVAASDSLESRDLDWTSALALSAEELDFGRQIVGDFLQIEDTDKIREIGNYLRAVFPSLQKLFHTGFIGWMQTSLVRFMCLGLVFETMYRLTVHLVGFETVQVSRCKQTNFVRCQYKMLDNRSTGICTPAIRQKLLATVRPNDRPLAHRTLDLAIKARNALAHGAVPTFDRRIADGMGHILVKAMTTLMQAGMKHMVQEAAYYRWQNLHPNAHGHDYEDWLAALDEIEALLDRTAQKHR